MNIYLRIFVFIFISSMASPVLAQKIESIHFNLYTDSLKKGTYNYINVDGKYNDGRWQPLTEKEISFTSSCGKFEGNSLVLDKNSTEEKVEVRAVLKSDNSISKSVIIYIKKKEDNEVLKTKEEILKEMERKGPKKAV